MAKELNEESTSEDIEQAVEEIVSEVDAERNADEPKPDAQITTEHASNDEQPVVLDEGTADSDRTVSGSEDSETTGEADSDWREGALAETSAYGIGEDELAEFSSREELDKALKLFDRKVMDNERQKVLEELNGGKQQEQPAQGKSKKGSDSDNEPPSDGRYEIKLDKDVYDEELVDELTRMRDYYESRVDALEQRFQEADAIAQEQQFDRTVDDLEFSNLFGKTGEESEAELATRKELYERVQVEQLVLSRLGRKAGDYKALVHRVARSLFPDEYDKKLLKNHTRRISRQSGKRQGGGVTRPTEPPEDPRDEADRLYREMQGA